MLGPCEEERRVVPVVSDIDDRVGVRADVTARTEERAAQLHLDRQRQPDSLRFDQVLRVYPDRARGAASSVVAVTAAAPRAMSSSKRSRRVFGRSPGR